MLKLAKKNNEHSNSNSMCVYLQFHVVSLKYLQINEEFLPFRNGTANLVISPFFLHWTNDILRTFREVYRVLIPDGFFTGALFAATTLKELREVLEKAELSVEKKMSPHVSPLPTPGAVGDALTVLHASKSKCVGSRVHHHIRAVPSHHGGIPRYLSADAPSPGYGRKQLFD